MSFSILQLLLLFFLAPSETNQHQGPIALATDHSGRIYIAQERAKRIDIFNLQTNSLLTTIDLPGEPSGLALSGQQKLYVTLSHEAMVAEVDLSQNRVTLKIKVKAGSISPVLDENRNYLYVCNRFSSSVSVVDLTRARVINEIPVSREPISAVLSHNGRHLFVGHHLPEVPSTAGHVAANISIINTSTHQVEKKLELPNGSSGIRNITLSMDGSTLFIPHILGRYTVHTSQLEQGWMNTNALSLIDTASQEIINTVILDDFDFGAANPWGCAVNQSKLAITHAGTHEISVIDWPALKKKLKNNKSNNVRDQLGFLYDVSRRIKLTGNGPRAITSVNDDFIVANFFSDSLIRVSKSKIKTFELNPNLRPSDTLIGEQFFHDATLCFQNWQSCSSCHPDARVDGLNWDLLNDGIGNPKNAKSMLLSHQTPPAMWTGARKNAEAAVRAGFRHIQFNKLEDSNADKVDKYLRSLQPVPSPYLMDDQLSPSAKRGKELFFSLEVGCSQCHPRPNFTDMKSHAVETNTRFDLTRDKNGRIIKQTRFDTPSLVEVWRTSPYLHDGRYTTIQEVITKGNHGDKRGKTSHLTKREIDDLVAFVLSL